MTCDYSALTLLVCFIRDFDHSEMYVDVAFTMQRTGSIIE